MAEWESLRHWVDTILDLLRFGASFLRRQKDPTSTNDVEPVSERAKPHNPREIDEISHDVIRIERVEMTVNLNLEFLPFKKNLKHNVQKSRVLRDKA